MENEKIVIIDASVMNFSLGYLVQYLSMKYPQRKVVVLEKTYYTIIDSTQLLHRKVRQELFAVYTDVASKDATPYTLSKNRDGLHLMFQDRGERNKSLSDIFHTLEEKNYDIIYICNDKRQRSLAQRMDISSESFSIDQSSFFEVIYTAKSQDEYDALVATSTLSEQIVTEKNIAHYYQKFLSIRFGDKETVYCLIKRRWHKLSLEDRYMLSNVIPDKDFIFIPRSREQKILYAAVLRFYEDMQLLFVTGPAGTGKTYSCLPLMLHLVRKYAKKYTYGLKLVKPKAYVADQDDGHLPGNNHQKNLPLYDSFKEMFEKLGIETRLFDEDYDATKNEEKIELLLVKNARGKNLDKCGVLMDESQNNLLDSIKTLVNRINESSFSIYSGDSHQVDKNKKMGLNAETSAFAYMMSHMIPEPSVFAIHMSKVLRPPLVIRANEA